jgi:adenylate kinase family enzyme
MQALGKRIIVVGTTGSGKTTLASNLCQLLNIPHIELDALYWEENWQQSSDAAFVEKVNLAMAEAGELWIIDGNYRLTRALVWPLADTVIWLDYPLWLIYWRLFRRSVKRIITREKLWNENQESIYSQFLAEDSLFAWAKETHKLRRETYRQIIANDEFPHLRYLHFRHPRETEAFLKQIKISAR